MGGASKFFMLLSTPFPLLCPRPSALRLARHTRVSLACLSSSGQTWRFSHSSSSRSGFRINASEQIHTQTSTVRDDYFGESVGVSSNARVSQSWPEWTKLVGNLREGGYFDRRSSLSDEGEAQGFGDEDAFSVVEQLPDEFAQAARACLSFARERSELLRLLSRKDIELLVDNGSPFLFKNSVDSARRMRTFLDSSGSDVSENERPHMVDLMRFLLSYAFNPTNAIDRNNLSNRELVESSVRNLLNELAEVSKMGEARRTDPQPNLLGSMPSRFPDRQGQIARPLGQNIEMKRGDWICPKCSFMNFARNMTCLECNEARPKRQLTGGEWECPQCDFFNYGRNTVCLRCDCKRPGGTSFGTRSTLGYSSENFPNKDDTERRLAANEEKAERWFSKVSQVDNGSGLSSSVADEDFPEIMPLRKGVNRFVVSTRKTPLERKLADAQFRRNLGNDGTPEENDIKAGDVGRFGPNRTLNSSISESLDRILGRSSAVSGATGVTDAGESNNEMSKPQMQTSTEYGRSGGNNSGHVPFVPLPADMFAKSQTSKMEGDWVADNSGSIAARANDQASYFSGKNDTAKSGDDMLLSEKPAGQVEGKDIKEQDEKSERWFKKVAELHDVTDLPSAISDEDFPEIMPMRKGENRFVVSKKKDRSLTSPLHKRRMAMEQASNTNFVPFVPFPPDYFAKKDKQPEAGGSSEKVKGETAATAAATENLPGVYEKSDGNNAGMPERGVSQSFSTSQGYQQISTDNWNDGFSGRNLGESKMSVGDGPSMETKTQKLNNLETSEREGWAGGSSWKGITNATNSTGSSSQQYENPEKSRETWRGKSLEGSAVKKEPDPLDMSEEAKTERWFRRVAQIKDISELSNIPDEDFPSIMPMRKGVNRFVVSKRKTPLERRLTSPQYRRNLPIVTSDPVKKENDTS